MFVNRSHDILKLIANFYALNSIVAYATITIQIAIINAV